MYEERGWKDNALRFSVCPCPQSTHTHTHNPLWVREPQKRRLCAKEKVGAHTLHVARMRELTYMYVVMSFSGGYGLDSCSDAVSIRGGG